MIVSWVLGYIIQKLFNIEKELSIFLQCLFGAISLLKGGLHHERNYNQPSKWIYRQNWQQIICPQSQTGQVVDESDTVANWQL